MKKKKGQGTKKGIIMKNFIRFVGFCLLLLALSPLWFAACASGGGSTGERGLCKGRRAQKDRRQAKPQRLFAWVL